MKYGTIALTKIIYEINSIKNTKGEIRYPNFRYG